MDGFDIDSRTIHSHLRDAVGGQRQYAARTGSAPIFCTIVGGGFLFMTAIALQPWVPAADLLRDPLAVAEMSATCCKVYFGFVSNLGSVLWFMAAAVCLFAAALLFALGQSGRTLGFMVGAALLTGWLGVDDLFLVHDHILPELGVPQPVTYAIYGGMALTYVALFWREILQSRVTLFVAAGILLAASVGIDVLMHGEHRLRIVFEDGAKLIGIALWAAFHAAAGLDCTLDACRSRNPAYS